MSTLTCVSGYWDVKNKAGSSFEEWFHRTLKINCPYIFFGDRDSLKKVKKYRYEFPTHYVELNIEDFYTYRYQNRFMIDSTHCPSLKLNLIWNEKIFLIKEALKINIFPSEFYCWIDAGICVYRDKNPPKKPFPNPNKLNKLPKNKFIYSSSNRYIRENINIKNYYHHISGGSYVIHRNLIYDFSKLYGEYLDKLTKNRNIWTDQLILSHMYKDRKDLFYKLCDGYGEVIHRLYGFRYSNLPL
tara:strand:+ start:777 stop:1505 length:729 start_codon:yes stop_codon:yes gene_type:complete